MVIDNLHFNKDYRTQMAEILFEEMKVTFLIQGLISQLYEL
jgi:hypothetical protein